jgi:hypothetical protein
MSTQVVQKIFNHPTVKKYSYKQIPPKEEKVWKKNGVTLEPLRYGANNNFIRWNEAARDTCAQKWINLLTIWDHDPPAIARPIEEAGRLDNDTGYKIEFTKQMGIYLEKRERRESYFTGSFTTSLARVMVKSRNQ